MRAGTPLPRAPRPAPRIEGLALSPIRAVQAGAPPGAARLGLGEPSWGMPEAGRLALARASGDEGPCAYGPNGGTEALREALCGHHKARDEELMVATGSQGALFALFQAWAGEGDEVLVPDPGFLAYPVLARLAGARAVPYALGTAGLLDAALFAEALAASPRARVAVVNHPANPTGGDADRDALLAVARLCGSRGLVLVSDEVYRELHFGTAPASLRDVSDYGIVLSSVSKAWAAPGLRIGWALGDPSILAPARLVHNYMVTAPSRPAQAAAAALVEDSPAILPASRAELRSRWETLRTALKSALGIEPPRPSGGFYAWLKLPAAHGQTPDSLAFCLRARDEAGVVLAPGSAFGAAGEGQVRLSFAAMPGEIEEGVRRLARVWGRP